MNNLNHSHDGATTWTRFTAIDRWYTWNDKPGTYAVILMMDGELLNFFGCQLNHQRCVVDDFGNLVSIGDLH